MKKLILALTVFAGTFGYGQNALLTDATTGDITAPTYDFEFVYDGTDLVLVTGSYTTGYLYAIDFNWTTAAGVHDWESNNIPDIVSSIAGLLGTSESNLSVWDMKVNPKTNAVVLLVFDGEASNTFLFEAKNPLDITLISMDDVTYSRVKYTVDENYIQDIEWSAEENKLYYSQGDFTLDASLGFTSPPFVHNSEGTIKGTSVFKSNWGGSYYTMAPLERLAVTKVNGENRLMGVTTCAPGFSIPTAEVNEATGIISVSEDFNVHFSNPIKTVAVTQVSGAETASYLYDLHTRGAGTQLIRIGESFLTGEVLDTNNAAPLLRTAGGNIKASFSQDEAMEVALNYEMIAFYSDYAMMVIDNNDILRLTDITSATLSLTDNEEKISFNLAPNPATNYIVIQSSEMKLANLNYTIYDTNGKLIDSNILLENKHISIESLQKGAYILVLEDASGKIVSNMNFIKS